jgi:ABC-type Mn2+/Zn2+ transport system ATPase subunit
MIAPLHRPPASFTALLGLNGAGKRTLSSLVTRHPSAWQGTQGSKSADPDHGRAFVLQTHWNFAAEAGVSILWELA